jgi:single-strand DNA-binding protein
VSARRRILDHKEDRFPEREESAMYATYTTLVGRVITAPERQTYDSGATRVHFRVACTERRRNGAGWDDGETLYITVRCWRQLADNVAESMSVGDPVIAHGKIFTRNVEREGSRLSVTEMDATAVGPDLRWATADVTRTKAAAAGAPSGLPEMASEHADTDERTALEMAVLDDPWASAEDAVPAPRESTESGGGAPGRNGTRSAGRTRSARSAEAEAAVRA